MNINSFFPYAKVICIFKFLLKKFQAPLNRWEEDLGLTDRASHYLGSVTPAWVNKGPFRNLQSCGWRDPSQPGSAWKVGQINTSYLSIELKVNTLNSPAVSRCLESIDFLLYKLDSRLLLVHIRPISNPSEHIMGKPAFNKPAHGVSGT